MNAYLLFPQVGVGAQDRRPGEGQQLVQSGVELRAPVVVWDCVVWEMVVGSTGNRGLVDGRVVAWRSRRA
jgi:hypothetical protein